MDHITANGDLIQKVITVDTSGNPVDGGEGGSSVLPAGTDRSGAITTGGTAQQLAASNSSRASLMGQNISAGDLWINEIGGTAAVDTSGSYRIASGECWAIRTNRAISIIGATTGQKFTATET